MPLCAAAWTAQRTASHRHQVEQHARRARPASGARTCVGVQQLPLRAALVNGKLGVLKHGLEPVVLQGQMRQEEPRWQQARAWGPVHLKPAPFATASSMPCNRSTKGGAFELACGCRPASRHRPSSRPATRLQQGGHPSSGRLLLLLAALLRNIQPSLLSQDARCCLRVDLHLVCEQWAADTLQEEHAACMHAAAVEWHGSQPQISSSSDFPPSRAFPASLASHLWQLLDQ